jgi:hypothetical protein
MTIYLIAEGILASQVGRFSSLRVCCSDRRDIVCYVKDVTGIQSVWKQGAGNSIGA